MEGRGQLMRSDSLLLPYGSRKFNSGHRIRHGGKHFYPLSHLTNPSILYFLSNLCFCVTHMDQLVVVLLYLVYFSVHCVLPCYKYIIFTNSFMKTWVAINMEEQISLCRMISFPLGVHWGLREYSSTFLPLLF